MLDSNLNNAYAACLVTHLMQSDDDLNHKNQLITLQERVKLFVITWVCGDLHKHTKKELR